MKKRYMKLLMTVVLTATTIWEYPALSQAADLNTAELISDTEEISPEVEDPEESEAEITEEDNDVEEETEAETEAEVCTGAEQDGQNEDIFGDGEDEDATDGEKEEIDIEKYPEIKVESKRYPFRENNNQNHNCYRFTAPESGEYMIHINKHIGYGINMKTVDGNYMDTMYWTDDGAISFNLTEGQTYLIEATWYYASFSNNDCYLLVHKTKEPESVEIKKYPDQKTTYNDADKNADEEDDDVWDNSPISLEGMILTEYYADGTSEDVAYNSCDSEGRRFDAYDYSWINETTCRVYVSIGNCKIYYDLQRISNEDVPELKLNQKKKFTGEWRQAFIAKFIPEETGYYSLNTDNTYSEHIRDAVTREMINGYSADGCYLERNRMYYVYFSLSATDATVKMVKGSCQWEIMSKTETMCGPEKTVARCSVHGDTWIRKWDIVEHNSQREDIRILKEATCGEDGIMATICSACHQPAEKWSIPATGNHKFSSWKTTKSATVFAEGKQEKICTVCGKKETKSLSKRKARLALNVSGTIPLKVGQSFTVKVSMEKGDQIVSWKSSDSRAVSVKNGKIKGIKAGKTATITVKLKSGKTASFKVKVQKNSVSTRTLKVINKATGKKPESKIALKKGRVLHLSAKVIPETSSQKICYTSSDKKIATVSSKGVIKGIRKGKTTVTVESGKKTYKMQVTVK